MFFEGYCEAIVSLIQSPFSPSSPLDAHYSDCLLRTKKGELKACARAARAISRIMGKSRECVGMKIARLGLEVVTSANSGVTTTTRLDLQLPVKLHSVEKALLKLADLGWGCNECFRGLASCSKKE